MTGFLIIIIVAITTITLASCKVSGRGSREEERREACETCVRWIECNGVDRDACPLCGAETKTPRED